MPNLIPLVQHYASLINEQNVFFSLSSVSKFFLFLSRRYFSDPKRPGSQTSFKWSSPQSEISSTWGFFGLRFLQVETSQNQGFSHLTSLQPAIYWDLYFFNTGSLHTDISSNRDFFKLKSLQIEIYSNRDFSNLMFKSRALQIRTSSS